MKKIVYCVLALVLLQAASVYSLGTAERGTDNAGTAAGTVPGTGTAESAAPLQEPVQIRIAALKGPTGFGMIKLFETAPDLGDGVSAELSVAATPDIMIARLLSGEVDIASLPTNVAAKLASKNVPISLAAVTGYGVLYLLERLPVGETGAAGADTDAAGTTDAADAGPGEDADSAENSSVETAVGPDAPERSETDGGNGDGSEVFPWTALAGTTVYNVGKGSTPEFVFEYLLSRNGLEAGRDVTVEYSLAQIELTQSFIAGRVRYAVLPEPFVTKVLAAVPDARVMIDLQKAWSQAAESELSYPMSAVVVRSSVAENRPEAVERFLSAYADSIAWVNANPGRAGELIERYEFGMNAGEAAAAIPRCNLVFHRAGEIRGAVESFLTVLLEFDPESVGGRLPGDSFYLGQ